jgi:hypothetical protein
VAHRHVEVAAVQRGEAEGTFGHRGRSAVAGRAGLREDGGRQPDGQPRIRIRRAQRLARLIY